MEIVILVKTNFLLRRIPCIAVYVLIKIRGSNFKKNTYEHSFVSFYRELTKKSF